MLKIKRNLSVKDLEQDLQSTSRTEEVMREKLAKKRPADTDWGITTTGSSMVFVNGDNERLWFASSPSDLEAQQRDYATAIERGYTLGAIEAQQQAEMTTHLTAQEALINQQREQRALQALQGGIPFGALGGALGGLGKWI